MKTHYSAVIVIPKIIQFLEQHREDPTALKLLKHVELFEKSIFLEVDARHYIRLGNVLNESITHIFDRSAWANDLFEVWIADQKLQKKHITP